MYELNDEVIDNARMSIKRLVDNLICLEMDEIESFNFPADEPFALEIMHRDRLFYFIIKFSTQNKNFICFAPGANNRDQKTSSGDLKIPPFFTRWKWHQHFDESTIAFADPMLFLGDEMKLGWFIGEKDHWYLETLSKIIEKLAVNQKVTNDNILFYGSSGGGFVSVCLATLIRDSKLLVNNAQFFVMNYYPRLVNLALDAIVPSFDGLTKDEVIDEIRYRIDTTELFKRQKYSPHITYYVNVKSQFDMTNQAMPLVLRYYEMDEFNGLDVSYYCQDSKAPHNPLPSDTSIDLIKDYAKKNLYNGNGKSQILQKKEEDKNMKKEGKVKGIFKKLF